VAQQDPKDALHDTEPTAESAAPESEAAGKAQPEGAADPHEPGDASSDDGSGDGDSALDVAELAARLAEAEDKVLRAHAEAQNARRRAEQEVEKARKFALEGFCRELLPVVDNLERALEAVDPGNEALKALTEGVELTRKSLLDAMARFQVVVVDPIGEPFDPQVHQAMSIIEKPDAEPNTVIAVMQKGYTLNGRLVRPAMVVVSKP